MNIFFTLFITFFKIGLFTIGGGYAMIPLIKEYIFKYSWATNEELLEFIAISESTPGPFAINISTFIGFKTGGFLGAFLSTLGVVLPSFIIILIIIKFLNKFKKNKTLQYVLQNLRPIILSLLIYSVLTISFKVFFKDNIINLKHIFIFLILSILNLNFKFSPIKLILISGFLGVLLLN